MSPTLQTPPPPPPSPAEPDAHPPEWLLSDVSEGPHGYGPILHNRAFLFLWLGQIFSQLGDRVVFVVFVSMLALHFGPSDRYTSYLYIAFTIPAILLTAIAGVFIDRWPRKMVLVATNVLRGVLVAFLPWASQSGLWAVYALAFGLSAITQFFVPAEAATIPAIVPKNQLMTANSLFTTTMMASIIFGFALGDPLINIFSLHQVHWAIVGLFLLASLMLSIVRFPKALTSEKPAVLLTSFGQFWAEMHEGIAGIRENPLIWSAMLKLAILFSAMVSLCILFIGFAREFLFTDPVIAARKFAYIITFSGVGLSLGAVLVGRYFKAIRRRWLVFGGYLIMGICLLLLACVVWLVPNNHLFVTPVVNLHWLYLEPLQFTARMAYTYLFATLLGMAASFVAIPLQALLHEIIPEDKRGKILGVQFTLLSTCSTLPVLVVGLGVEALGTRMLMIGLAIVFTLLGLRGLVLSLAQKSRETPREIDVTKLANW